MTRQALTICREGAAVRLQSLGQLAAQAVLCLIVRRVPARGVPRWDVFDDAGALVVAKSARPFEDGAAALLARGIPGEQLVTMRHQGAAHDSFVPVALSAPAGAAKRRAARLRALEARRRPEDGETSEPFSHTAPPRGPHRAGHPATRKAAPAASPALCATISQAKGQKL